MHRAAICARILLVAMILQQVSAWAAEEEDARCEALIRQATAQLGRGRRLSEKDLARSRTAMEELRRQEEKVTRLIVELLSRPRDQRKLTRAELGHVLWEFGPERVRALEPEVLHSQDEEVRETGVRILGQGGWKAGRDHPEVVALVVRALRDDPAERVRSAAIEALVELRAVDQSDAVLPLLESEEAPLRRAAAFFFWDFPSAEARPILERRLKEETEREVCDAVARTLCQYDDAPVEAMLTSGKPGVRQGVLREWRIRGVPRKPDAGFLLPLIEEEKDPVCRAEFGLVLASEHQPACIPLLIEALQRTDWPAGVGGYPVAAMTSLANNTDLPYRVTDEDRKARGNLYGRVARLYLAWWEQNGERVRWDEGSSKFIAGE